MRVSEQSRLNNHHRYLQEVSESLDHVQRQLSSGRRIDRASDDPAGAAIALHQRQDIAFERQMRRNIEGGRAFLNFSDAALGNALEVLHRARDLTVQAATDNVTSEHRATIAREIDGVILQLAQVGNSELAGAYIFAGHKSKTPAYAVVGGSSPTAVTYNGDAGTRDRRVAKSATITTNVTGGTVFGSTFDDLIALRDNLDAGAPPATLRPSLQSIDAALDRVLNARAQLGARINRLDAASRQSEEKDIDLQQIRARIEEIDLPETIVQLQAQEASLQATLGAIGRTANMSLMNFLR